MLHAMAEVGDYPSKRPPAPLESASEAHPASSSKHSSEQSSPSGSRDKERFYFDSDILVLKNNPDYQKLLKTLAVLEAQKIQAIKDLECLGQTQAKAEKDPLGFVRALKDGSLPPLPRRQVVAEIPNIEWKGYIESLQQVAKQHSSLYINTRRHSRPLISSLDEKPVVPDAKGKEVSRSATYRQPWTPEEQTRFEELLKVHPPEKVERKRYQKIARALGTRTTQQVCTHAQKYFIKLAQSGLPVPGRVPNLSRYTRKRKKGRGRRGGGLRRPSTFFTTLTPRVFMTEPEPSTQDEELSSDEGLSDDSEMLGSEGVSVGEETGRASVTCSYCESDLTSGVYWHCSDCPQEHPTHLCSSCVNSDYRSAHHPPSHDLEMLSVANSNQLMDKDYSGFTTQSGFTYLDPNYHPPC